MKGVLHIVTDDIEMSRDAPHDHNETARRLHVEGSWLDEGGEASRSIEAGFALLLGNHMEFNRQYPEEA